eukprot:1523798-Rhodomonas_salina.5
MAVGAVTLCSVLRSSEKLTHISLKDNRGIGDGGAALLSSSTAVRTRRYGAYISSTDELLCSGA